MTLFTGFFSNILSHVGWGSQSNIFDLKQTIVFLAFPILTWYYHCQMIYKGRDGNSLKFTFENVRESRQNEKMLKFKTTMDRQLFVQKSDSFHLSSTIFSLSSQLTSKNLRVCYCYYNGNFCCKKSNYSIFFECLAKSLCTS